MIERFKDNMDTSLDIHIKFRKEYNLRVLSYLCGKNMPVIPWYDPINFKEDAIYNTGSDVCGLLKQNEKIPLIYEKDNISKILQSIDNSISKDKINEDDIKNIFESNEFIGGEKCDDYDKDKCNKNKKNVFEQNICVDNICPNAKDKETCEIILNMLTYVFGTVIMEQTRRM